MSSRAFRPSSSFIFVKCAATRSPTLFCQRSLTTAAVVHEEAKSATPKGSTTKLDAKAYGKTLLLPKTTFPLWNDPSKSDNVLRERTCGELYRWQWENAKGPLFVLHDGPPYANGDLHMGHALNKILKDVINRFHVSLGRKVHYVPGWDCHGLPIENKALQELGKDALSVSTSTIRGAARATAIREVASQKEQFKKFGIMADWNSDRNTYRTLDHDYEIRQLKIFQEMVQRGLVYRDYRPVHYSPSSHSALAEAELVFKEDHVSHSVYVKFKLDTVESLRASPPDSLRELLEAGTDVSLLVWTTTPWTLTANMGIAIHNELSYCLLRTTGNGVMILGRDRLGPLAEVFGDELAELEVLGEFSGSSLTGLAYKPIFSEASDTTNLKIVPSSHVTSESGTGMVHCAPAHGAEDYHVFRGLGLLNQKQSMMCHVNSEGRFRPAVADVVGDEVAKDLIGKEVLKGGSKAVVELLEKVGALAKIQKIKHKYPYDWKTNEPIIVMATSQWFANLDNIKHKALNALEDVGFVPSGTRNRLESFIRSRSEWCISRQRSWGVPIPSLHYIPTDQSILSEESLDHILKILDEKGVEYWWEGPVEEFVPPALRASFEGDVNQVWKKGTDTMDVWFDSGTSWSMLRGLEETREGDRRFYADVCLEGSDQHRGWFQSQLLTAVGTKDGEGGDANGILSPYKTLITHGMVLDQHGKKMSKSLGNIISPLVIVDGGKDKKKNPAYGADVLRLWAATVEFWRDMSIGPTVLAQAAESMRKIRNSARFMLGNIGVSGNLERVERKDMGLAERYVMHELYSLEQLALTGYASYDFPKVMNALTHFTNITLSSLYFDITKDSLYADAITSQERRAVVTVLELILKTMTSIIAPVLPHLAEEIHATRYPNDSAPPSVFMTPWKVLNAEWHDPKAAKDMESLLKIRSVVLGLLENARRDKLLKSSLEAQVEILLPPGLDIIGLEENPGGEFVDLLFSQQQFLKTLFIVSEVWVTDEGSLGVDSPDWLYVDTVEIPGLDEDIAIRVRPATNGKCPRCWTYTKAEEDDLCRRCEGVLGV
ncbi:isoleucyl-tRNA synthetase [Pluteus cervinus]|uniref:Isoleucyl-tRNA synthetase n=1 Tax=Pluteus cervinus TaxID=181527 RepID=A0ACD3B1H5_9AGAR|nr:isoleucyl-tRNA synthetase [Pluteus cervinus]